jgi:exodeoxyribonuclease VII large subunit
LLTSYVRELFEQDELLTDLWIEGEVSNVFESRASPTYFTLTDADSQIRCVMFRGRGSRKAAIRAGDRIAAHGQVTVYPKEGQYQLYADAVQPAGIGLLALELALLRQRLEAEGLFEPSRKRPLPSFPKRIGVVTSAEGAVWHDIQQVMRRRYPLAELILAPTAVQGERAPEAIVAALEALQADGRADVIIVARGGGSAEDLWCFNDERVVRAVFACRVPVVSGVGHETDWTLIDDVADLRAPTPSAAAELCSPSLLTFQYRLAELVDRLSASARRRLETEQGELRHQRRRLSRLAPSETLAQNRAMVDDHRRRLAAAGRLRINEARAGVASMQRQSMMDIHDQLGRRELALRVGQATLDALDPSRVLERGYSVLTRVSDGGVITRSDEVVVGERMDAWLAAGRIRSVVESTHDRQTG